MDKDNKTSAKEEREKMGRVIEAVRVLEDISKKQSTIEEEKRSNPKEEKQTSLGDMVNEVIVNLDKEMHLCKICGEKIDAEQCFAHKEKTGHNEFRPSQSNDNQQIKGGIKQ